MAYDISWFVDKRIFLVRYLGVVTLHDLEQQRDAVMEMARHGIEPIHVVLDTSGITRLDVGLGDLRSLSTGEVLGGWTFIITTNPMYRFLGSVALQLNGGRFKIVGSMADAKKHLLERDPTLTEFLA